MTDSGSNKIIDKLIFFIISWYRIYLTIRNDYLTFVLVKKKGSQFVFVKHK